MTLYKPNLNGSPPDHFINCARELMCMVHEARKSLKAAGLEDVLHGRNLQHVEDVPSRQMEHDRMWRVVSDLQHDLKRLEDVAFELYDSGMKGKPQ